MKSFKGLFLFGAVILFLVAVAFFWVSEKEKKEGLKGGDLKLGVLTEEGLEMISISTERKIISVLKVDGEMQLWISDGLGWYKANKIKKILSQEKKKNLPLNIFFYNFGFIPDKILFLENFDDWKTIGNLGIKDWLIFKFNQENMIVNEESLKGNFIDEKESLLDEIMMMNFADSRLVNEESRLSIINTTDQTGLADFIGDRLGWNGFSVVSVETSSGKTNKCLLVFGSKFKQSFSFRILDYLYGCEKKEENALNEDEAELYLGEELVQMLKYSSYKH